MFPSRKSEVDLEFFPKIDRSNLFFGSLFKPSLILIFWGFCEHIHNRFLRYEFDFASFFADLLEDFFSLEN